MSEKIHQADDNVPNAPLRALRQLVNVFAYFGRSKDHRDIELDACDLTREVHLRILDVDILLIPAVDDVRKDPDALAEIALSHAEPMENRERAVIWLSVLLKENEALAVRHLIRIADPNKLLTGTSYCPAIHGLARKALMMNYIDWKRCTAVGDRDRDEWRHIEDLKRQ